MTVKIYQKAIEDQIEKFMSKGGSVGIEEKKNIEPEYYQILLRVPNDLVQKLDGVRKSRVGKLSRNQAIVEAIQKYLGD